MRMFSELKEILAQLVKIQENMRIELIKVELEIIMLGLER